MDMPVFAELFVTFCGLKFHFGLIISGRSGLDLENIFFIIKTEVF